MLKSLDYLKGFTGSRGPSGKQGFVIGFGLYPLLVKRLSKTWESIDNPPKKLQ
jgi:hypothetical protein